MHWAKQAVQLGARSGKQPEDVTLTRAFQFRRKREKLDHIFKSKPVFERVTGPTFWQISLRNAFSRYVPVGHEFSGASPGRGPARCSRSPSDSVPRREQHRRTARAGLFTEISERPPELLSAPLEIFGKPRAFDPARSATAQALSESLGLTTRRLLRTQEEKGRAWLQGSYLEVRVANPAAAHDSVIPHDMCRFKPHTASSACMGSENIA